MCVIHMPYVTIRFNLLGCVFVFIAFHISIFNEYYNFYIDIICMMHSILLKCIFEISYFISYNMTAEEILYNHGGEKYNILLEMLHLYFPDTENIYNISPSYHYSCDAVIKKLNQNMNQFTELSFNCQSLGAKFDKLLLFLNKLRQKIFLLVLSAYKRHGLVMMIG